MAGDEQNKRGVILVISAPSGTGKTTLCKKLLRGIPDLHFSVSYTTRPPRPREISGKDYHFVSPLEFAEREEAGEFLEREEVFGHLYGTSGREIEEVLKEGGDVLLDVETRGAKKLKETLKEAAFIFILPPSLEALKERLMKRGSEDEADIARRLDKAVDEIRDNYWYDYIVINDKINNSLSVLKAIYVAEKNRRIRQLDKVNALIHSQGGIR